MLVGFALIFGTWLLAFALLPTVARRESEIWLIPLLTLGSSGSIVAVTLTG